MFNACGHQRDGTLKEHIRPSADIVKLSVYACGIYGSRWYVRYRILRFFRFVDVPVIVKAVLPDGDPHHRIRLRVVLKHLPRRARIVRRQQRMTDKHQKTPIGRDI